MIYLLTAIFLMSGQGAQLSTNDDFSRGAYYLHDVACDLEILETALDVRESSGRSAEIRFLEGMLGSCSPQALFAARLANRYIEASEELKYSTRGLEKRLSDEWLQKAHDWALMATQMDASLSYAFEMRSTVFGVMVERVNVFAKASLGDSVRMYAEIALELDATNHRAMHILGRWHYEVANLPWYASSGRRLLTNGAGGTFEEAATFFERAIMYSDEANHYYWLGMTYIKLNRMQDARTCMTYVANAQSAWDESLIDKAREYLNAL